MKLILLLLALAAGSAHAIGTSASNYTNFYDGVGVGRVGNSTYVVVTGVAEVYKEIELTSILTGTNGTTALADTAITTGLYVANPTGLTLSAGAIFYPAETNGAIARIGVTVPTNYRSGGRLLLDVHVNSTFTAGAISMTASAVQYPFNGLTNTTLVTLAPVQISTTASQTVVTFAFPVGVTLTPDSKATYHVTKTGTYLPQIVRARFGFRPWGVLNGN